MTRRARMGPIQTLGRGVDRMAPGGRRSAAESPIRPFHRPVGEAGVVPPPPEPGVICVAHVADPDSHTFRPTGGGTITTPIGHWWYVSMVLTADVGGDPLRLDFYNGGVLTKIYAVDAAEQGPFTAGRTITWSSTEGAVTWERFQVAAGYTGTDWASATSAQYCYYVNPGPPAAARKVDS